MKLTLYKQVPVWNLFVLSTSFLVLFTSYEVVLLYATSWDEYIGSVSFGTVFLGAALTSPVAPFIVQTLGFKYSLLLSFIAYVNLILSYYIDIFAYIMFSSICTGIFVPIIWTAEGSYLTQITNVYEFQNGLAFYSQIGWFKGVFFAFYGFKNVSASLIGVLYWDFGSNPSNHQFFLICFVCSLWSCPIIWLLRSMDDVDQIQNAKCLRYETDSRDKEEETPLHIVLDSENVNVTNQTSQIGANVRDFFDLWRNKDYLYLIPFTIYYGFMHEFMYAEFPTLIDDNTQKFAAYCCFGISGVISAYVSGQLVDIYDCTLKMLVASTVVNLLIWSFLIYYEYHGFGYFDVNPFVIWVIVAMLLGFFGMLLVETLLTVLFAKYLGNQPSVFANQMGLIAFSTSMAYFMRLYISMVARIIICMCFGVFGTSFLFLHPMNRAAF